MYTSKSVRRGDYYRLRVDDGMWQLPLFMFVSSGTFGA